MKNFSYFWGIKPKITVNKMKTSTIIILAIVIVCLAIVAFNRYHHRQHHYNVDKLGQTVKDILTVQPEKMMKRNDFILALQRHYNCHRKEALWLVGYAKEHGLIKGDDKWVEMR